MSALTAMDGGSAEIAGANFCRPISDITLAATGGPKRSRVVV